MICRDDAASGALRKKNPAFLLSSFFLFSTGLHFPEDHNMHDEEERGGGGGGGGNEKLPKPPTAPPPPPPFPPPSSVCGAVVVP